MVRKRKSDLSLEDIKFLKAVQRIENTPEDHPGTDETPAPANTSVLKNVLDLSENQIRYRMLPDKRGFDEMGLLICHDKEATPQGYKPRSVELTDEGRKAIDSWEKKHGELDLEELDRATIEDVEVELEHLHGRIDDLEEEFARVDAIEQSEYGAVDSAKAEKLDRSISLAIAYHKVFEDVLGISPQAIGDEVTVQEAREQIKADLGLVDAEEAPEGAAASGPMDVDD